MKRCFPFVTWLIAGLLMVGIVMAAAEESHAAKIIRFAYEGGKANAYGKTVQLFQQEVEKRTKGSLKVNVFFGGSLAGGTEALQMVKMGNCEMYMDVTAPIGSFMFPKITVLDIPYLFKDMNHQFAVLKSPIATRLAEEMVTATGVRILGYIPSLFRSIASTKEIRTPQDLKGFKIRSVQSNIDVATWKRLGAQPVTLPWGEIYTSLATNLIGGLAAAPGSLLSGKFQEVCKYLIKTEHQAFIELYIINEAFYQGLTAAEKRSLQEAMAIAVDYFVRAGIDCTEEFASPFEIAKKDGVKVVEPDKAAFAAALKGIENGFIPESFSRDLFEAVRDFKY